ncbi:unnamed protein product [Arabidopsis arenosa]|uniref:Transposase MuDR plant domain-containing protein n=1 Tax=Arabidopsis arenosa TaxID=38785 RepID=A0A8S2AF41_ARAAE|nr:unnamed protein product [Arabidopsis arenosa]
MVRSGAEVLKSNSVMHIEQQFNSGEEFKDQLLRYVLKTNYDVKLCKWGQTQLAAICSHEKCKWKIYCSVDKGVKKWVVKTYVDAHAHAISGIPCPHAIFVIGEHNRDPEDYVDRHLETKVLKATYKDNIEPVNGERLWKRTGKGVIEVPDKRKKRGRPKKFDRIKEPSESSTNPTKLTREGKTVTCSNCKQIGHNKGTCKNQAVQSAPPRKRGRPRKSVHSSAPAANPSGRGRARGRPPGVKNGQGKGKGKGRGKGSDEAPRPPVFFMSPWTDKVFDVWRPEKK